MTGFDEAKAVAIAKAGYNVMAPATMRTAATVRDAAAALLILSGSFISEIAKNLADTSPEERERFAVEYALEMRRVIFHAISPAMREQ